MVYTRANFAAPLEQSSPTLPPRLLVLVEMPLQEGGRELGDFAPKSLFFFFFK